MVLNYGSLNLDYVYTVDHFVHPGETLASSKRETFCGGKGLNQSIALAKAGCRVFHAGKIGVGGELLKARLEEFHVDTRYLKTTDSANGHTVIQVDKTGQNCILLYGGSNRMLTETEISDTLSHFSKNDILLLQNETNAVGFLLTQAARQQMDIAFNPSPIDPDVLKLPLACVHYFFVNEIEGNALTGETDPQKIGDALLQKYPGAALILTLGAKGSYYRDKNEAFFTPAYPVKVVDTTGAGDTFTGFFLSAVCADRPKKECMEFAAKASSIAVSRRGASDSIPTFDEVKNFSF